jgi:hypothetical protein
MLRFRNHQIFRECLRMYRIRHHRFHTSRLKSAVCEPPGFLSPDRLTVQLADATQKRA